VRSFHRPLSLAGIIALLMTLPSLSTPAGESEVRPFGSGSLAEIRAARTGRAFILKFWSLDCAPCRAELPAWTELSRRHPQMDLILVNTDSREHAAEAAALLDEHGLGRHEYWVFAHPFPQQLRLAIDPNWYGELPRTYFHSRDHSHHAVSGRLPKEQVERWICAQFASGADPGPGSGACR
jgi:thiol-disulfide isomerase/thioredoxin